MQFSGNSGSRKKGDPMSGEKMSGTTPIFAGGMNVIFRWKNSLYKLVYKELILYLMLYGITSIIYRFCLSKEFKRLFDQFGKLCEAYGTVISLPFLLGFYLTIIANRWWSQFLIIPWPDRLMHVVVMYIPGRDEYAKSVRRVLMRRCLLMLVLLLRSVSMAVERRYHTLQDLVDAGLMSQTEMEYYNAIVCDINLFWVPGCWFTSTLQDAAANGVATDSIGVNLIMKEFLDFRHKCGLLWSYNWISIPMVYTQIVSLAVYTVFAAYIFSRQHGGGDQIDMYFPIWTALEFVFYMGLLKIAEILKDPFGEDEGDFDLNFLISRHLKVLQLSTDDLRDFCPPLKDEIRITPQHKILPLKTGYIIQND